MPPETQPNSSPWSGTIIPWSAALRTKPSTGSRTLADLPRGESVKVVLRARGWLYVECELESKKHVESQAKREQGDACDTPVSFQLAQPKIVAIATDGYLRPTTTFADPLLPGGYALGFGQDLSFSSGRTQSYGSSVGTTAAALRKKMRHLLTVFASNDTHGKTQRLFDAFLAPQWAVSFWSDAGLNAAAEAHPNITTFVSRALSAPNSPERTPGQTRIHQALENAGWDINAAVPATGLGVPAFNRGSKTFGTEDFGNGLGVMINGIQHVIVIARDYCYDGCKGEYYIKLEYVFYDVFGLDDDDLREFGADGWPDTSAAQGITAWWQLQHQYCYAPLITRIAFEREFRVPVPRVQPAGQSAGRRRP